MDETEHYRRLNNTRKTRAKKFLADPLTRYQIISTLTLACILAPMVRLFFALHECVDSAKASSQAKEKRFRARMFFKGQYDNLRRDGETPIRYNFADVSVAAQKAVDQLWEGSVFRIACAFWPAGHSKTEMFASLCDDRLLNLCQIKWRISYKFLQQPFCAANLDRYNSLAESPPGLAQRSCDQLMKSSKCCLDPHWGQPIQELLSGTEPEARLGIYFKEIKSFFKSFRPTSLKEEKAHSVQRKFAGGFTSVCTSFPQQACSSVLVDVATNYHLCGGRDLKRAPTEVRKHAKRARLGVNKKHKRPRQFGNAMFTYISKSKGSKSTETAISDWKGLSKDQKDWWRSVHQMQVRQRKKKSEEGNGVDDKGSSAALSTPLHLGCADWPLKLDMLEDFLRPFRSKQTGMAMLENLSGSRDFPAQQECQDYKKQVEAGRTKYHSMTAAALASKAISVSHVSKDTRIAKETMKKMLSDPGHQHHCLSKHPGCCKTRHSAQIKSIQQMVKLFPRVGCVVRCELAKKVIYAKVTVGRDMYTVDPYFQVFLDSFAH